LIRCCDPRRLNEQNFTAMSKVIGVQPGQFYDLASAGSVHFWAELIHRAENLAHEQIGILCQHNKCNLFLSFHADCKGYRAYISKSFNQIEKLDIEMYKSLEKYLQLKDVKYVYDWIHSNYPNLKLHIIYSAICNNCNIFEISEITIGEVKNEINDLEAICGYLSLSSSYKLKENVV
jgi:hypothetical protein